MPPICAYFSMIRQLDNIKFALLLPEFVYGKKDGAGNQPTYGEGSLRRGATNTPDVYQCNLMSGTQPQKPILWLWLQLKWLKNIFQAILCAKEKANEFIFFQWHLPRIDGVASNSWDIWIAIEYLIREKENPQRTSIFNINIVHLPL